MPPIPPSAASTSGPSITMSENLSLPGARLISLAAEAHAAHLKLGINLAIVDTTLQLLHFARTPTAKLTSIQIAMDKAFTAAGHRAPTHMYMENAVFRPGGAAEGIGRTNGGRFCTIGGGIPVKNKNGDVIGAIGASGGTPAQDREIVEAGLRAWEESGKGEKGLKAKL